MSLLGKIKSCQPVPECFLEILPVCEIPESGRLPASSLLSWRARRAWVGMEGLGGGRNGGVLSLIIYTLPSAED